MLKKINANGVESNEGFVMQITGPEIMTYKCGDFEAVIAVGYNPKLRKIYVYASKLTVWKKYVGDQKMSEDEKSRIIKNISDAVKLLDGDFEVV